MLRQKAPTVSAEKERARLQEPVARRRRLLLFSVFLSVSPRSSLFLALFQHSPPTHPPVHVSVSAIRGCTRGFVHVRVRPDANDSGSRASHSGYVRPRDYVPRLLLLRRNLHA